MNNPTPSYRRYTGHRRHPRSLYLNPASSERTARIARPLLSLLTLALFLGAALLLSSAPHSAYALNTPDSLDIIALSNPANPNATLADDPEPSAPKATPLASTLKTTSETAPPANPNATYTYISCPTEIYRGTLSENQPAEILVDDFEELPAHWLYVLSSLPEGESYFFTLDLACRTQNSPFTGQISATYSSYVPDDGSLGSVRIEATEEIAPDTFLVYYGELKYISDGTINLTQTSYGSLYDHHLFYFSLATTDLPSGTEPLGEQRVSRLSDPAVTATVSLIGDTERLSNVYDEDLLHSDYMYPYYKYNPAEGSRPDAAP